MGYANVLNKAWVLEAIRELSASESARQVGHSGDGLLSMNALVFTLGARRESIESMLRELEADGLILCVPAQGPVTVLALTELAGDALRISERGALPAKPNVAEAPPADLKREPDDPRAAE